MTRKKKNVIPRTRTEQETRLLEKWSGFIGGIENEETRINLATTLENQAEYLTRYQQPMPPQEDPRVEEMPYAPPEYATITPRRLNVHWTREVEDDLRTSGFGIRAEEELANAAAEGIRNSIVREYPMGAASDSIYYLKPEYSNSNINTGFLSQNTVGDFTFMSDNKWFMKITKEGEIKFNMEDFPNITADAQAKLFLEALKRITHMDGKQYTFDF